MANLVNLLSVAIYAIPLIFIAIIAWNSFELAQWKRLSRTHCDSVWEKVDAASLSPQLKQHVAEHSTLLHELGFRPIGTWLATETAKFKTHAACFLHPERHCVVELIEVSDTLGLEIVSFLDEGSVISSSNANLPNDHLANLAQHGYFVQIARNSNFELTLARHTSAMQAASASSEVSLRELTADNWREYAIYNKRHFSQCMFMLGKLDHPPEPFTFPRGNCVHPTERQPATV